jgi:hypothetical protein
LSITEAENRINFPFLWHQIDNSCFFPCPSEMCHLMQGWSQWKGWYKTKQFCHTLQTRHWIWPCKGYRIMATVLENLVSTDKGTTSQHLIKQFVNTHSGILEQALRPRTHILGKHRTESNTDVTYQTHSIIWISRLQDPPSNMGPLQFNELFWIHLQLWLLQLQKSSLTYYSKPRKGHVLCCSLQLKPNNGRSLCLL